MGTLSLSAASITYLTVSIFKVLIAATPNLFSVAYVKISFTFALLILPLPHLFSKNKEMDRNAIKVLHYHFEDDE